MELSQKGTRRASLVYSLNCRGFAILSPVIGMAILVIALVGIYIAGSASAKLRGRITEKSTASQDLARAMLSLYNLAWQDPKLSTGTHSLGALSVDASLKDVSWIVEDLDTRLKRITVKPTKSGRSVDAQLIGYRYDDF